LAKVVAILPIHGESQTALGIIHLRQGYRQEEKGARAKGEGGIAEERVAEEEGNNATENEKAAGGTEGKRGRGEEAILRPVSFPV
jgi:hypothetical protein